ncbi:MAG TPA: hypothetical protein DEV81_01405 [Cyanobacteria bacterium UBA11049]|nr:hypothetical protein [Cyanobacteria bacterium UBA11049]
MDTKVKTEKYIAPSTEGGTTATEAATQTVSMLPPAQETNAQWRQISNSFSAFLAHFPTYWSRFFETFKLPIISLGLILATIVTLRVIFAVVDALNGIPLFSAFFEFIGIGYAAWFVYRYLLKAETRQELAAKIQSFKQEIVGENS